MDACGIFDFDLDLGVAGVAPPTAGILLWRLLSRLRRRRLRDHCRHATNAQVAHKALHLVEKLLGQLSSQGLVIPPHERQSVVDEPPQPTGGVFDEGRDRDDRQVSTEDDRRPRCGSLLDLHDQR